ncbi:MAG: DUF1190 domain-containing protein [Sphingomonadaceae bacterium]
MAVLGGSVALAGCGGGDSAAVVAEKPADAEEFQVFQNVFECASKSGMTKEECTQKREEAIAAGKQEAPRYEAREDCEEEWGEGKCAEQTGQEETRHHRSHFSPFIGAFFWSRMNRGTGQPLYSTRDNGYQTANGTRLGYAGSPGKYYASARALESAKSVPKVRPASSAAKAAAASRGGFGEKSRGWGLSSRSGGSSYSRGG